jgi:hypothetical protein
MVSEDGTESLILSVAEASDRAIDGLRTDTANFLEDLGDRILPRRLSRVRTLGDVIWRPSAA